MTLSTARRGEARQGYEELQKVGLGLRFGFENKRDSKLELETLGTKRLSDVGGGVDCNTLMSAG